VRVNSTSAASAVVSGMVALIRGQFPKLSVAQVTRALIAGVGIRHKGAPSDGSGYGTADAAKALAAATKIYERLPAKPTPGAQQSTAPSPPSPPAVKPVSNDKLGRTLVIDAAIAGGVFVCLLGLILAVGALRRRRARTVRLAKVRAAAAPPSPAKKRKQKQKQKQKQPSLAGAAGGFSRAPAGSLVAGPSATTSPPVNQDPFGPRSTAAEATASASQPPDEITLAPMAPPQSGSPAAAAFGLPAGSGANPATVATGDPEGAFPTSAFSPSPGSTGESRTLGLTDGSHRTGTVRSPEVSGNPPWDPAPEPDSQLPWTQPPTPGPVTGEAETPLPGTPDPVMPDLGTLTSGPPAAGAPLSAGGATPAATPLSADADTGTWEALALDAWPGGPQTAVPHPPAELPTSPSAGPGSQGTEDGALLGSFTPPEPGPASMPQAQTELAWPAAGDPAQSHPPWELESWQPSGEDPATLPPASMPPAAPTPPATAAIHGAEPSPRQEDEERAGAGSGPRSQEQEAASPSSRSQSRTSGGGSPSPLPRRVVRHRQDARPGAGPPAGHSQFVPSSPPSDLFTASRPSGDPPPLFPPVPPAQASVPFSLLQSGESTETFAALPSEEPNGSFQPAEPEGESEKTETFPAISPDEPGDR
jgi:hypothetical protein